MSIVPRLCHLVQWGWFLAISVGKDGQYNLGVRWCCADRAEYVRMPVDQVVS